MTEVVIAIGSNEGDSLQSIDTAVDAISELSGVQLQAVSPVVSSIAHTVDGPDAAAPRYLNAVVTVDTELDAHSLLAELQRIEQELGRPAEHGHWAPRTIDLDLVAYGTERIDSPTLQVPHPRAAERVFVLQPWLTIDPDAQLLGEPVATLLDRLDPFERQSLSVVERTS